MVVYSQQELAECARREVTMRRRVYPHRVQIHTMTQEKADQETDMMLQIETLLRQLDSDTFEQIFPDAPIPDPELFP